MNELLELIIVQYPWVSAWVVGLGTVVFCSRMIIKKTKTQKDDEKLKEIESIPLIKKALDWLASKSILKKK